MGFDYDPHTPAGSPPSPQWLSVANEQQWEAKAAHTQPEGEEVKYVIHNMCITYYIYAYIQTYIRITKYAYIQTCIRITQLKYIHT